MSFSSHIRGIHQTQQLKAQMLDTYRSGETVGQFDFRDNSFRADVMRQLRDRSELKCLNTYKKVVCQCRTEQYNGKARSRALIQH